MAPSTAFIFVRPGWRIFHSPLVLGSYLAISGFTANVPKCDPDHTKAGGAGGRKVLLHFAPVPHGRRAWRSHPGKRAS